MSDENQLTTAEAQSALEYLNKIENETILYFRPPLWLITMISLSSAIFVFSLCAAEHENSWALGMWLSGIPMFLLVVFWNYSLRLLGMKGKPLPFSGSGKVFVGLQMLFFAVGMFVGREATVYGRPEIRLEGAFPIADLPLAPYITAIIFSLSVAYLTYKYPTNEWVQPDASK